MAMNKLGKRPTAMAKYVAWRDAEMRGALASSPWNRWEEDSVSPGVLGGTLFEETHDEDATECSRVSRDDVRSGPRTCRFGGGLLRPSEGWSVSGWVDRLRTSEENDDVQAA